jgi:hypothetical protein
MAGYGVKKIWLNVHFDDKLGFIRRWRDVMTQLR